MTPIFVSSNPQEPTDWRAVCGRTARTVRREGSRVTVLPYPYRRPAEPIGDRYPMAHKVLLSTSTPYLGSRKSTHRSFVSLRR